MEPSEVLTTGQFRTYLQTFADGPGKAYTGSLEEYLRALWAVVKLHHNDQPTYSLFAQLILNALNESPPPFDEKWLAYDQPPEVVRVGPELVQDDFAELERMLLYQIADLHRMQEASTLDNPYRYYGVDSLTGHGWFNFHPADFFGNGSYGLREGSEASECNWADLALQLWLGQIYE